MPDAEGCNGASSTFGTPLPKSWSVLRHAQAFGSEDFDGESFDPELTTEGLSRTVQVFDSELRSSTPRPLRFEELEELEEMVSEVEPFGQRFRKVWLLRNRESFGYLFRKKALRNRAPFGYLFRKNLFTNSLSVRSSSVFVVRLWALLHPKGDLGCNGASITFRERFTLERREIRERDRDII